MTPAAGRRAGWLEELRAYARRAFQRRPELRSLLVAARGAGVAALLRDVQRGRGTRGEDMLPDEPEAGPRWLELPRARDLYALVRASPADDEPRRVLGDHLFEHGHPRGELIALSLAGPGAATPAAIARQGELLAAYGRPWQRRLAP